MINKLEDLLKDYVDMVGGKMTLLTLYHEIGDIMIRKKPTQLIVTIEKKVEGYISKLYIPKDEFYPKQIARKDDGELLDRNKDGTYSFNNSMMEPKYKYPYEVLMNSGKFEDVR